MIINSLKALGRMLSWVRPWLRVLKLRGYSWLRKSRNTWVWPQHSDIFICFFFY